MFSLKIAIQALAHPYRSLTTTAIMFKHFLERMMFDQDAFYIKGRDFDLCNMAIYYAPSLKELKYAIKTIESNTQMRRCRYPSFIFSPSLSGPVDDTFLEENNTYVLTADEIPGKRYIQTHFVDDEKLTKVYQTPMYPLGYIDLLSEPTLIHHPEIQNLMRSEQASIILTSQGFHTVDNKVNPNLRIIGHDLYSDVYGYIAHASKLVCPNPFYNQNKFNYFGCIGQYLGIETVGCEYKPDSLITYSDIEPRIKEIILSDVPKMQFC